MPPPPGSELESYPLEKAKLRKWVKAYKYSILHEPYETRSCLISLAIMERFMRDIIIHNIDYPGKKIDAIRFYLIRSREVKCHGNTSARILSDGTTRQLSLAIIPATDFQNPGEEQHRVHAKDCSGTYPIPWIVPGYTNEHSGLCPTNCEDSI